MIHHTFCHINGIGQKTERRLWAAGIRNWAEFAAARQLPVGTAKISLIMSELADSREAMEYRRPAYFADRLPAGEQWRIFGDFLDRAAYIDIETDGLTAGYNSITTIALYDGQQIRHYVNGENLHQFVYDIRDYDLLITYNGKSFDLPFMERFFGIRLDQAHIDLRYVLHSLGYKGGLKGCEKQFGISRDELDGVDGYFAVLLWHAYEKHKDRRFLETLLAYNIEDVVNLEYLMYSAYNLKAGQTPFASNLRLAIPPRPEVPFSPSRDILASIKRQFYDSAAASGGDAGRLNRFSGFY